MAIVPVNVGTAPDDGTGDTLLAAANKINASLAQLNANLVSGVAPITLSGGTPAGMQAKGTVLYGLVGLLSNPRILGDVNWYFDISGSNLVAGFTAVPAGTYSIIIEDADPTETVIRRFPLNVVIGAPAGVVITAPTLWLAGANAGLGNGSSAANAMSIFTAFAQDANIVIAPGTDIGIVADQGPITLTGTSMWLQTSGTSGNPIKLRGVASDGRPMAVRFEGGRYPYLRDRNPDKSTPVLNNNSGSPQGRTAFIGAASFITMEDILFQNLLNGIQFIGVGTFTNWTINRVWGKNVQRVIEHPSTVSLVAWTYSDGGGKGFSKQWWRIRGDSNNITVNNCVADSERQDNDSFAVGSQISDTAHNITFNNTSFLNSHMEVFTTAYANADGVSGELGNYDIFFNNCIMNGSTDGGTDFKSRNIIYTDCTFQENKRNVRTWGETTLIRPVMGVTKDRVTNQEINLHCAGAMWTDTNRSDTLVIGPATIDSRRVDIPPIAAEYAFGYSGPIVVRLINVTEPHPERNRVAAGALIWRAASLPGSAPAVTGGAPVFSVAADTSVLCTIPANQECIVRKITGPDAALVTAQVLSSADGHPTPQFLFQPTAFNGIDDSYNFTVTIENIGRMQTDVAVTVNVSAFTAAPYIAAMNVAPSAPRQAAINSFVNGMVAAGYMKYFDVLGLALHDEQSTLLNLMKPTRPLIKNGGITLTPNLFYTGNGTTGYLSDDLGWVFTGSKFSQNNGFMGALVAAEGAGDLKPPFGSDGNGLMAIGPSTAAVTTFHANDTTNSPFGAAGSRVHNWASARIAASGPGSKRAYVDGALAASLDVASAAPRANPTYLRANNFYSPDGLFCWYRGGGLPDAATMDAMMQSLHTRLQILKAALAA